MKLQANTLILLGLALFLGLGVYIFEQRQPSQPAPEEAAAGTPIFKFKEDQVQALTIKTQQTTLSFERSQRSFPHTWLLQQPKKVPADAAAVAYLLNLLATGKSERSLSVTGDRRQEFGLDQPMATLEVTLTNQQRHQLVLGKLNFDQSGLYALADPPTSSNQNLQVLIVPTALESAVNRPLAEWQQQPQQQQPTPTPDVE